MMTGSATRFGVSLVRRALVLPLGCRIPSNLASEALAVRLPPACTLAVGVVLRP